MVFATQKHKTLSKCLAQCGRTLAQTQYFIVYAPDPDLEKPINAEDLIVVHHFESADINNNIGYFVVNELIPTLAKLHKSHQLYWSDQAYRLNDQQIFERYVGEIVRSMDGNEARAWHNFYDNTLSEIAKSASRYVRATQPVYRQPRPDFPTGRPQQDFIESFAAIYQCTLELLDIGYSSEPLSLLDVATCFGFLPLFIQQQQEIGANMPTFQNIVGCDNNPALTDLANNYIQRRKHKNIRFILADILATNDHGPVASQSQFDVVTAIHLLEHLQPHQTDIAIANLWQLTRRRLIISVPFEEKPDKQYGHLQVFDPDRLRSLAERFNTSYQFFENRGGWIVLDRPPNKARSSKRSDHHAEVSH